MVCKFGSDYPRPLLDDPASYLFGTEEACLEAWGAGLQASPETQALIVPTISTDAAPEERWYPESAGGDAMVCRFGNDYPLPLLDDPASYLFDTEGACLEAWGAGLRAGLEVQHVPPAPRFWYPHEIPGSGRLCRYGNGYDPGWYDDKLLREELLFDTEDECCDANPDACSDSSWQDSNEVKWYPYLESYEKGEGTGVWCVEGRGYPDYYLLEDIDPPHLFNDEGSCCAAWECDQDDLAQEERWYPEMAVGDAMVCKFGNDYPLPLLDDPASNLFDTERACLEAWGAGLRASLEGQNVPPAPRVWYPHEIPGSGKLCRYGNGYEPGWYDDELLREELLFDAKDECCDANPDACPDFNRQDSK